MDFGIALTFSNPRLRFDVAHLAKSQIEQAVLVVDWVKYYKKELDLSGDLKALQNLPGGYFGVDPIPEPDDIENVKKLTFFGTPFLVGDPDDAIAWVENSRRQGFTHLVLGMQSALAPELAEKSIRLFAHHVLPRFRDAKSSAGRNQLYPLPTATGYSIVATIRT